MAKITQFVEDNMYKTLEEIAPGERIDWDVNLQIINTEVGPQPVLFVALTAPSGVIGQNLFAMNPLPLFNANNITEIKGLLRNSWSIMQQQRSQILGLDQTPIDVTSKLVLPK